MKFFLIIVLTLFWFNSRSQDKALMVRVYGEHEPIDRKQLNEIFQDPLFTIYADDNSSIVVFLTSKKRIKIEGFSEYKVQQTPVTILYNRVCNRDEIHVKGMFIEYSTHITKFNVQQVPQLQNAHDNYLKKLKNTGNVLFEGVFDNDDGGLLIMRGTVSDEVVTDDPTIKSGFIIPEIRNILLNKEKGCY